MPFPESMPEHVAAPLCYLLGWVSGMGFLIADKRPFVRYHAAQSVVVFGTLSAILLLLSDLFVGALFPHGGWGVLAAERVVAFVWIVSALFLMLKAGTGEKYRVPFAASFAERAEQSGTPKRS